MLDKVIKKLRSPGVLIFLGAMVLVIAGAVLALCLRPHEATPQPPNSDISNITEEPDITASGDEQVPSDSAEPSHDEQTPADPTDPSQGEQGGSDEESQPTVGDETPAEPTTGSEDPTTEPTSSDAEQPGSETPGEDPSPDNTEQPTEPADTTSPTEPQVTEPATEKPVPRALEVEQVASFSGAFVEDGSDEPVENIAAVLVTNHSEQYLDLGTLIYDIGGTKATFVVTGLPSGASAWVMEASRMQVSADAVFTQKDCTTSFRANAVSSTEDVTIQSNGTMLKAINNTDKTLKNVTVYYKVLHSDGNYFGGITYMVSFGDLEPGQSAEKLAGHFKEGWTDIVRIGYQTET